MHIFPVGRNSRGEQTVIGTFYLNSLSYQMGIGSGTSIFGSKYPMERLKLFLLMWTW